MLKDSEQGSVLEDMKEGAGRLKVRMCYDPGINWRGSSVKYSDTCLIKIIKYIRTVNFDGYWFDWNFVLKKTWFSDYTPLKNKKKSKH